MLPSALLYAGIALALAGVVLVVVGFALPARETHVDQPVTQLDAFMPRWQFSEHHQTHVDAWPERVFEAIRAVRADEIALFRLLTWIRRGGRKLPEGILNAGTDRPLLDVATSSGFIYLADDAPRELVIGTTVIAPRRGKRAVTPELFRETLPPGFAIAAMNFRVTPDGGGSLVTTDTRVYANDARSRRNFKRYWRMIYPGSALIRVMWLRAVARRAEGSR
jgi:hypothetical protein